MNEGLTIFGYFLIAGLLFLGLLASVYAYAVLSYAGEKDFPGAMATRLLVIVDGWVAMTVAFLVAVDIFCKGGE